MVWVVGRGQNALDYAYHRHRYFWFRSNDDIVRPCPAKSHTAPSLSIFMFFSASQLPSTSWILLPMQLPHCPRHRCVFRAALFRLNAVRVEHWLVVLLCTGHSV